MFLAEYLITSLRFVRVSVHSPEMKICSFLMVSMLIWPDLNIIWVDDINTNYCVELIDYFA
jgi:hypothetical protein